MKRSRNVFAAEEQAAPLCFYSILSVHKTATPEEIKKAYYRKALLYHPDKVASANPSMDPSEATLKFQQLGLAYKILSTASSRRHYDLTGEYAHETETSEDVNWSDYFKSIFASVTVDAIEKIRLEYQGSPEEENDLVRYYKKHRGNMDKVFDEVLFTDLDFADTQERLIGIINKKIKDGQLKPHSAFGETTTKTACNARIRKHKKNERKFERSHHKEKENEGNPLPAKKKTVSSAPNPLVLPNRKEQTEVFLSQLAKKYSKKHLDALEDPLSDQQFDAIQSRIVKNTKKIKK